MLLVRIKMHDESVLARQVYEESKARGWPGLGEEVSEICEIIGIPDVNHVNLPKQTIISAIERNHYEDLKSELEHSKKLKDIKDEDFSSVQEYFKGKSVENTRMAFKIRSKMVTEIPGNVKNRYKNKKEELVCKYCSKNEELSQSHVLECSAWVELKSGLDLNNIMDLVIFFRKMLAERVKLEEDALLKTASHDS